MRLLTHLARLIRGEQQKPIPLPVPEAISPLPIDPTGSPDSATRPTRRVQDHELLKLHKAIDLAG